MPGQSEEEIPLRVGDAQRAGERLYDLHRR